MGAIARLATSDRRRAGGPSCAATVRESVTTVAGRDIVGLCSRRARRIAAVAVIVARFSILVTSLGVEPASMRKRRCKRNGGQSEGSSAQRENVRMFHIVPPRNRAVGEDDYKDSESSESR